MSNPIDQSPESPELATWAVPREWAGDTAFIIAGGPSLRKFHVERLRGRGRVIVINRMVLPSEDWPGVPWADVLYFCDCHFWTRFAKDIRSIWQGGRMITLCNGYTMQNGEPVRTFREDDGDLLRLVRAFRLGLSHDPRKLAHGSSSGYQAINLAYLFGAKNIVLLGYDLKFDAAGRTHAHDGYGIDQAVVSHQLGIHASSLPSLAAPLAAAGVQVVNASPESSLTIWPTITLDEMLAIYCS